ncbi:DNA translocase FtsK [Catenovulum sediminis]|uniref:DNA translocase FtsK n=1 Tax=Catenovulum sediminis TaxID=1740262 RepID=A0ABV1RH44_9ALTE
MVVLSESAESKSLTGIQRLLEVGLITFAGGALFILLALVSFDPLDPSWSQSGYQVPIRNMAGAAGAWLSDLLLFFFGAVAYLVPFAVAFIGWALFQKRPNFFEIDFLALGLRIIGLFLLLIATTSLSSMNFSDLFVYSSGGLLGDVVSQSLIPYFNFIGTTLLLLCFFCTGITLLFGISWLYIIDKTGESVIGVSLFVWRQINRLCNKLKDKDDVKASSVDSAVTDKDKNKVDATTQSNTPVVEAQSDIKDSEQATSKKPSLSALFGSKDEADVQTQRSSDTLTPLTKSASIAAAQTATQASEQMASHTGVAPAEEPALHDASDMDDVVETEIRKEPVLGDLAEVDDDDMQTMLPLGENCDVEPEKMAKKSAPNKAHIRVSSSQTQFSEFLAQQEAADAEKASVEMTPLPSFELLDRPDKKENPITQEEMDQVAALVEAKLADFGVDAKVVGMYPGPVITRLELDLAPGVKVSKITNLSKDIARSLSAVSVRVVEVIPGKSFVGLELPNKHREVVKLSEVISGSEFADAKSPLTMVLGQDIAGKPVVVDLARMPHLLVAGTTGSGKSVGVNVMILSLLYKSTPEEVRLIMIDPKMLELSVYEGIPHLLCEVVTDMKEASNALRWCVGEMERRYKLMSAMGVRNVKGFNTKVSEAIERGEPLKDPLWKPGDSMDEEAPELEKLPSIVVVIDEFADMMMIVGKKVEELIARIAQKARAAGIHLILATQRPSVDVITGLIKANIPTRIAFQVSSKIDSRTILDQQGAETLLGMGDMLYLPAGKGVPTRVHGAFVDDHEVHAVVADWQARGTPVYIDDILNGDSSEDVLLPGEQAEAAADEESDALYDEAVAFVTETRKVSVSSVQRKFRIGYNRAARIVEQMEATGVVSSAGHNGAREVLAPPPPRMD